MGGSLWGKGAWAALNCKRFVAYFTHSIVLEIWMLPFFVSTSATLCTIFVCWPFIVRTFKHFFYLCLSSWFVYLKLTNDTKAHTQLVCYRNKFINPISYFLLFSLPVPFVVLYSPQWVFHQPSSPPLNIWLQSILLTLKWPATEDSF